MSEIKFNAEILIRLSDPTLVVIKPIDLDTTALYARDPVNLQGLLSEIIRRLRDDKCLQKSQPLNVTETV